MWILFSILCMLTMTSAEIIGKKAVSEDGIAPLKLRIMGMAVSVVIGMLMHFLRLGESGLAPWTLITVHPIMLAITLCIVLSEFLYLFSLKYVGMTIMEAISSLEGIVIFACLIIINIISGNLSAVKDMFIPARLAFILLILVCTVLLPNIELFANRKNITADKQKREKSLIGIGILLSLLAVIFDCGDSLITDTLLDAGAIGTVDITMTAYFSQILLLPIFCFALAKKSKLKITSCKIINRYSVVYAILYVAYIFMGVVAISYDAVRSEVMFLIYPVISIVGAKIVLKEKYTWIQNICIWVITLAAIGFCVIDYVI